MTTRTISRPALLGREVAAVSQSGAPQFGPLLHVPQPGAVRAPTPRPGSWSGRSGSGLKTIVFTQARKITELIHMWSTSWEPGLKISSYRAGFLPSERRRIERSLASGELDGVVSTSALELGIDIGELDLCLLVGYPGTVVTTSAAGRAGGPGRPALGRGPDRPARRPGPVTSSATRPIFSAGASSPRWWTRRTRRSRGPHLVCAAAEIPLSVDDAVFDLPAKAELLKKLEDRRELLKTRDQTLYVSPHTRPHAKVNIRSVGQTYTIMQGKGRKVIGTLDEIKAFKECHPEAVYLHLGRQHLVDELDLEGFNIMVHPVEVDYYTRALAEKETEILEVLASRPTPNFVVRLGRLKVTEQVTGFEKTADQGPGAALQPYPGPAASVLRDRGVVDRDRAGHQGPGHSRKGPFHGGDSRPGARLHRRVPPFWPCATATTSAASPTPSTPKVGKAAVFIYDGYPGGVGLAKTGFERIEELLDKARDMVATCGCEEGCPSCIHSPKCGAGNKPLDKPGCLVALEALLGKREWTRDEDGEEPVIQFLPDREEEKEEPARLPLGVFDLETQRLAQDVGGWKNVHLMGLACAVVYDGRSDEYLTFTEDQVGDLIALLAELPLVVGFNHIGFDYQVLSAYSPIDFRKLNNLDLLADIHQNYGFRISLDALAQENLGAHKTADGLESVAWYKSGQLDKVIDYCRHDVEITKDLLEYGLEKGHVAAKRQGHVVELKVDWARAVERARSGG